MTESASTTSSLIEGFAVPLEFIAGAIVLFVAVPKIIGWFKEMGAKKKTVNRSSDYVGEGYDPDKYEPIYKDMGGHDVFSGVRRKRNKE
jgi:hypothetical protein